MAEVWEQHEGEPDEAYTRFLFYRDIGPTRSLEAAYEAYCYSGEISTKEKGVEVASKSVKKRRAPGQWHDDSRVYQWVFRANQWDIHILSVAGREVITNFYKLLAVHGAMLLEAAKSGKLLPKNYQEFLMGVEVNGNYISPEAVAAWRDFADSSISQPEIEPADNIRPIRNKQQSA